MVIWVSAALVAWGIPRLGALEGTGVLDLAVLVKVVKMVALALAALVLMEIDLGTLVVLGLVVRVDLGSSIGQIVQADLGSLVEISQGGLVEVTVIPILVLLAALEKTQLMITRIVDEIHSNFIESKPFSPLFCRNDVPICIFAPFLF